MAKLKNVLLMALSFALVAVLAIGGTVAYLTDTDSTVNVMTVGNVKIEQQEWQRAEGVEHINDGATEGQLVPFVQGQSILPAVPQNNAATDYSAEQNDLFMWGDYANGGNGLWDDDKLSNVIDKIVMVKNTGNTNAYYRTIIAIECPEGITIGEPAQGAEIMINVNGNSRFDWEEDVGYITVNDVRYEVLVAQYNQVLKPNEVSRPSLLQLVLTHNATSEDCALLGSSLEVLVLSQAVQADGFDEAAAALKAGFGEATTTNIASWFEGTAVNAKPESGAVRPAGDIPAKEGEVIDGLVVIDDSDDSTNLRALYTKDGDLEGDLTVKNSYLDGTYAMNVTADETKNAALVVENTDLRGWVSYSGFKSASFTDCTFDANSNPEIYNTIRPYDDTTFTNCEFSGTEFWLDMLDGAKITFVNCTYNGVAIDGAEDINIVYGDASSIVIG